MTIQHKRPLQLNIKHNTLLTVLSAQRIQPPIQIPTRITEGRHSAVMISVIWFCGASVSMLDHYLILHSNNRDDNRVKLNIFLILSRLSNKKKPEERKCKDRFIYKTEQCTSRAPSACQQDTEPRLHFHYIMGENVGHPGPQILSCYGRK